MADNNELTQRRNIVRGVMLHNLKKMSTDPNSVTPSTPRHGDVLTTQVMQDAYRLAAFASLTQEEQNLWPADWLEKTINEVVAIIVV